MNTKKAIKLAAVITDLLTGHDLVTVSITPSRRNRPEVRLNQSFKEAYTVDYGDGTGVVAIHDSYGVMTGAETWEIDADSRTIYARTTNMSGEPCIFSWTVTDRGEETYRKFSEANA